ncbi:MAG: acyl-CoA thioester hydrolase [Marinobacter maritimus]|jgi:acyl-CoA thioester hydrolase|uniref:acyl-CoA thioesterase n=1 Tax=Marinobacter maritimus TaxID=277961 RepID=UPI000BC3995B|nr:thioesterase family protein [Marinobacter maritimus]MBL1271019.1 acyl-CoA thioesterase [Oceanospirillales bacterium]|tara:strand:+ start:973 stop:1470 length:498 start_codon:yes stop_codon:yes gene_type:complete
MTQSQEAPEQEYSADQPFRYFMQVRYSECDAQQVVFNARYGDYIDLAATEFLHHLSADDPSSDNAFDYQVVKLTIEWKAPARYRDKLEISVRTTHLGNTSFALTTDIRNATTGEFLATGEMIGVAVHPRTLGKVSIPEAIKYAMKNGGQGQSVDHAGLFTAPQTI